MLYDIDEGAKFGTQFWLEKITCLTSSNGANALERAHKQMQEAMTELITNKNYSEAERLLHVADKLMLDLIEDMGGTVVRSGLWT